MIFSSNRRNRPMDIPAKNPEPREVRTEPTDVGHTGFDLISKADPESGYRKPVGATPVWPRHRYQED